MSVHLLLNMRESIVLGDLQQICQDPGLQLNTTSGQLTYTPTASSIGGTLLDNLINHRNGIPPNAWVGLRGEVSSWSFDHQPGNTLRERFGISAPDVSPGVASTVHIVYDVTECEGRGFHTFGDTGQIPMPRHVVLYHELVHASLMVTGRQDYSAGSFDDLTIAEENLYRDSLGLPLRVSIIGGCN